jgi:predicted nucleic acid-binding protein
VVLLDSSVWIDHLRKADLAVTALLEEHDVLCHPFVIGELACGSLARRQAVVNTLSALPMATLAENHEVLSYIDTHKLFSLGLGFIDIHLLASCTLSFTTIWTRDRRLNEAALALGLSYSA